MAHHARQALRLSAAADRLGWLPIRNCCLALVIVAMIGAGHAKAQTEAAGEPPATVSNENGVTVGATGSVQLHVSDLPLSDVLRLLSIRGKRNIVASPGVTGTVTANLYDVTFEDALGAILMPNGAGFRRVGNFIFVHTQDELVRINSTTQLETRVFRLNYVTSADAKTYVEPLIGEGDSMASSPLAAVGLASEAESGGSMSSAAQDFLVVTASPQVLDKIAAVLSEIDTRPTQVLIEATILRAQLDDENALGIDFTMVGGVDLQLLGATSQGLTDLNLGALPENRFERFNGIAQTDFAGDVPSGGLTLGVIKDKVAVFVRALEQVTDTAVVANPKVLALNRQKGQVIVGRRDGFLTTTITETQAVQTVEFLETGTQLIFRPFVGDDGYVRVELHPEDSVGFVSAQGLPSEQTTEVTTNVILRDGETILIGGLFREVTTSKRGQVPVLGSIPGIGPLFRSQADDTSREEVIILLTITVVKDHEAYAAASHKQWEYVEQARVGVRQGLMWHGRERLAQSHYRKALDAVESGDLDRASWYTKLALHNDARFIPAMQLRQRLTGQPNRDHDSAESRLFIFELIARERGYPRPSFQRRTPWNVPFPEPDAPEPVSSEPDVSGSTAPEMNSVVDD